MNAPHRTPLAYYCFRSTICGECKGEGTILEPRSIAGEWIDADYVEIECDECSGTGEIDSACAGCSRVVPIDEEGVCASCSDEPLTEVTGDPFGPRFRPSDGAELHRLHPDGLQSLSRRPA